MASADKSECRRSRAELELEIPVKTTTVSGVAGGSYLLDLGEEGVGVAVVAELDEALGVTAGLAFDPEFLARSAPVRHLLGGEGAFDGFAIHPGQHQNLAVGVILGDARDETVGIELQLVEIHTLSVSARIIRRESSVGLAESVPAIGLVAYRTV